MGARASEATPLVAYLVFSYREPPQVARLAKALASESPAGHVVVRHDQARSRLERTDLPGERVHLIGGDPVSWGDFSQVEAVLEALAWTRRELGADWIVLLSGQDYPVAPPVEIERFLAECDADALIGDVREVPGRHPAGGVQPDTEFFRRYHYRHFRLPFRSLSPSGPSRAHGDLKAAALGVTRRLAYLRRMAPGDPMRLGIRRVRVPYGPQQRCWVSSDWMTVSARAADALAEAPRDLRSHYRRSVIPTESFYATVLLNDPGIRVHRDNMRLVLWEGERTASPKTLTIADAERIASSGRHFARKFEASVDSEVLDALDRLRRNRADSLEPQS